MFQLKTENDIPIRSSKMICIYVYSLKKNPHFVGLKVPIDMVISQ